jgi:hypothetical protein
MGWLSLGSGCSSCLDPHQAWGKGGSARDHKALRLCRFEPDELGEARPFAAYLRAAVGTRQFRRAPATESLILRNARERMLSYTPLPLFWD